MADLPVLLLTTTGRRTGAAHTSPLGFVRDGRRLVVAAANGGRPVVPDWYRNLVATDTVTVEVGSRIRRAVAATVTDGERPRLWAQLAATLPGLTDYAVSAGREIPVVALTLERTDLAGQAAELPRRAPRR